MGHGGSKAHRFTLADSDNVFLAQFVDSVELVLPLAKRDVCVHHHPGARHKGPKYLAPNIAPIPGSNDDMEWLAMFETDFDAPLSKPTWRSSSIFDNCFFS